MTKMPINTESVKELVHRLQENISLVIKGKDEIIRKTLLCFLCGGHILLEDLPGTGKTTLAKSLAKSLNCEFKRVQFTPDLLPSDLTGINFYHQKKEEFIFRQGAIFTNVLLADEINRATPRTQSSLLECMEEGQVSVDGETYQLSQPFLVIATQNPIEIQGTYPLPEAQLDRFFMKLSIGYPGHESEKNMLSTFILDSPLQALNAAATGEELIKAQQLVRGVLVGEAIREYIVSLAEATREDEDLRFGVSPRGSLALMRASQANAAVEGRNFVLPDDVKSVCKDVWCHRLLCRGRFTAQDSASHEIIQRILARTKVPTENS